MRSKPNVICFLTDDQGTLDARCYGAKHLFTPNIDRLAATGIQFMRAYSHSVCCPARANFLTGRHAQRTGINFWTQNQGSATRGINIHSDEETMAQIFARNGYRTALFGKWHLGAAEGNRPLDMGFHEFFGHLGGFIENYTHHFLHGTGFHDLWDGAEEISRSGEYFPRMVNDRALAFIEENKSNPFYLFLPYNLPHYPEQAEDRFAAEYSGVDERVRKYGMTVSTVDALIGEVIDAVEKNNLREDTIFVFFSDNGHSAESYRIGKNHASGLTEGWVYGAHGAGYTGPYTGSKGTFNEGGIRVPCILSAPGMLPSGVKYDSPVSGLDWLPTLISLCHLSETNSNPLDGVSLAAQLRDGLPPETDRIFNFQWGEDWAVIRGMWKLIGNTSSAKRQLLLINDEVPERINYLSEKFITDAYRTTAEELENTHTHWLSEVRSGYERTADTTNDRE